MIDRLSRLAARALRVQAVSVSRLDSEWPASWTGEPRELPRCLIETVLAAENAAASTDTAIDASIEGHRELAERGIVAYLGQTLRGSDGQPLGTAIAIDTEAREWTADDVRTLAELADLVVHEWERGAPDASHTPAGSRGVLLRTTDGATTNRGQSVPNGLRRFVATVEHSGDFIGMATLDSELIYVNPAGRRLVGLDTLEPERRLRLAELLAEPSQAIIEQRAIPAALAEGNWLGEGQLRHLVTGAPIDADINVFLVRDPERDEPIGLGIVSRDARVRKQADARMRETEALARAILEASPDGLITIDHVGAVVEFNPAAEQIFGFDRAAVIGRKLAELIMPPEQRSAHEAGLKRYGLGGGGIVVGRRLQVEAIHSDGTRFPIELAVTAVDVEGPPLFTASLRDISERKRAESRLLESEQRFRNSFDNAPIGIALIAPDGRWLRVNRALRTIVGYSEADLLASDFQCITHPDDLADCLDLLRKLLDNRLTSGQIEKRYRHRSAKNIWVLMSVSLVRDSRAAPLYFIAQIQDVTERREIDKELRRAKEVAVAASRAKTEFLANMSHEVRTPMAAILGYADMLLDPELEASDRDETIQAIRRNGVYLLQIINDILDLSQIESGKVKLSPVPYSPWQIVLEALSTLEVRADEHNVTLEAGRIDLLPRMMLMDPTRVRQIFMNLVGNAIKFSRPQTRVEIRIGARRLSEPARAELRLDVEDQGIGMSPEQLEGVFTPFRQVDSSTTRKFGGAGLGLGITRSLIEAMGGTISVQSELGKGSCFSVRLPLRVVNPDAPWTEPVTKAVAANDALLDGHAGKQTRLQGRILLAEDNLDNQRVMTYLLTRVGLKVEVAENGRVAVERARAERFDVVLMDMQMPVLDGYGATSSLRRSGYRGPIIALTAHAMPEDREKCLLSGCTDFLTKPVDPAALHEMLARYISLRDGQAGSARPGEARDLTSGGGAILSLFDGDAEFAPLVREFTRSLPDQVGRLRDALARGDVRRVAFLAHQSRGVGGMYGYPDLTEAAGLIEDATREGRDADLISELVDEFAHLTERIHRGLRQPF